MQRNFNISGHFEAFINSQIASGKFQTADQVVEEALRQMESRQPKEAPPTLVEDADLGIELGSLSDISALMGQMQREMQAAEAEEED